MTSLERKKTDAAQLHCSFEETGWRRVGEGERGGVGGRIRQCCSLYFSRRGGGGGVTGATRVGGGMPYLNALCNSSFFLFSFYGGGGGGGGAGGYKKGRWGEGGVEVYFIYM